jgi:hypothetical protein
MAVGEFCDAANFQLEQDGPGMEDITEGAETPDTAGSSETLGGANRLFNPRPWSLQFCQRTSLRFLATES